MHLYQAILCIYAGLITFVFIWKSIAQSKIEKTLVLHKSTDDGESLTVQLSLHKGQTDEERKQAIQDAFKIGEERREFVDARFKKHLEEERAKIDSEHLRSV